MTKAKTETSTMISVELPPVFSFPLSAKSSGGSGRCGTHVFSIETKDITSSMLQEIIIKGIAKSAYNAIQSHPDFSDKDQEECIAHVESWLARHVRGEGGRKHLDPVTKEAKRLAVACMDALLAKRGIKKADLESGVYAANVAKLIPQFMATAKVNMDLANSVDVEEIDLPA